MYGEILTPLFVTTNGLFSMGKTLKDWSVIFMSFFNLLSFSNMGKHWVIIGRVSKIVVVD